MLRHKMSVWYAEGHDEELARKDAYEEYLRQVEQRGHIPANPPRVHLIRDNQIPGTRSRKKLSGFRVAVQGDIQPKPY